MLSISQTITFLWQHAYVILVTACLCNTCDSMPIYVILVTACLCNKWSYSLTCQNSITITTLLGLIHQSYTYYEFGKVLCLWVELPCSTGGLLSNQLNTLLNTACGRKSTMWCHMLIFIHAWIRFDSQPSPQDCAVVYPKPYKVMVFAYCNYIVKTILSNHTVQFWQSIITVAL